MKTTLWNSPPARTCVILSALLCVKALAAANAGQPRVTARSQTPAYAEGGLTDPCAVGPRGPGGTVPSETSNTPIPLAKLLDRTRNQAKALENAGPIRRGEITSCENTDSKSSLFQELWSSRIAMPETTQDVEESLALKRLIHQVRSVKFASKDAGPAFKAPDESPSKPPSPEIGPTPVPAKPTAPATVAAGSSASPSNKTQKTLDLLQQNPNQVRDPLEMAELLFLSGRPVEAAPFYAKALDRINRIDPSYDADRAWILFQLGNCLRETDANKAQETYMKLVSEYPQSPWTELAKAHGRLITWYQKSRSGPVAATPQL